MASVDHPLSGVNPEVFNDDLWAWIESNSAINTTELRLKYGNDMTQFRITNALQMLVQAMEASQSTNPYDIALALEDMRFTNMSGEELWMRGEDHQIIQPLHISVHTDQNIVVDADNSGFGLYRDFSVPGDETVVDHSCRMRRPRR